MAGETNLSKMLETLSVTVRPERYTVCMLPAGADTPPLGAGVAALITEAEGVTIVTTVERAESSHWPFEFEASWITLNVHSALEAVGLTAAFSRALGDANIACNVLAGYTHDHILVPVASTQRAVEVLENLGRSGRAAT